MIFQQLVNEDSGCLSYLIGCSEAGQAIVVDPGRDRVTEYLRLARKKGLRLAHVVETHTHADHISGARDLAATTKATIHVHDSAGVAFEHQDVRDGDTIRVGNVEVRVAHTPGHTPDSICLFVTDHARSPEPWFVLTGDLLFVGSVGRPDLGGATAAEDIWSSLKRVLLPLDDSVEIYPAHGAGSSCGKAMSAKSGSTIGFERRFNPAFRFDDKNAFVDFIMAAIPAKPAAFDKIVAKNRGLVPLVAAKPRPYAAREAWEAIERGACVVDLRDVNAYGEGHVAGALNVWIDSPQFAERVAGMVPTGAPLLLMGAPSDFDRAVVALSRVGVDEVAGFLQWGMVEWRSEALPSETVPQITAHDLAAWLEQGRDVPVIDVREPAEWDEGHIAGAISLPMFEAVARRRRGADGDDGRRRVRGWPALERRDRKPQAPRPRAVRERHRRHGGLGQGRLQRDAREPARGRHGRWSLCQCDRRGGRGLSRAVVPVAEHEAGEGDRGRSLRRAAGSARDRSRRPRRSRRLHAAQRTHDRRTVRVRGGAALHRAARALTRR